MPVHSGGSMSPHLKALGAVVVVGAILAGLGYKLQTSYFHPPENDAVETDVPDRLPSVVFPRWHGGALNSEDLRGQVVILNFWATWCGPCVEEIPSLIRLTKELKSQIRIIALSNDDNREEVVAFLKSFPEIESSGIEIVFDKKIRDDLVKTFKVGRLPESFVFNSDGKMIRKVLGGIDWASPEAIEYLRGLAK